MEILHSKIYGEKNEGVPLLVLHGLFGMLDNWGGFAREAEETTQVHLIDLRNHGKSFHSEEMSIAAMSQDLLNYMQYYKIEKADILGHSLGGKVVMQFALDHSEKVQKLIVADMGPKAYPPHHQGIFKGLNSINMDELKSRKEAEGELKKYVPEESTAQFLLKNLYWDKNKKLQWRFNLPVLTKNYEDIVTRPIKFGVFEGQTLFVAGGKSHYILPQDQFMIKQQFPKAGIKVIEGAGHWIHAEKPKEFFKVVMEFLNS